MAFKQVTSWNTGAGLALTALTYGVYILPTLGFIAQFHPPPPDWARTEAASQWILVKGPRHWARPSDLQQFHHWFGFPWEFDRLEDITAAAQLWALARAGPGGGSLGINSRYRRVLRARRSTNRWGEEVMWDQRLSHNASANLLNNQATLANQGIIVDSLEADLVGDMPLPLTKARDRTVRHGIQAATRSPPRGSPWPSFGLGSKGGKSRFQGKGNCI
jgi:hypothetical protein